MKILKVLSLSFLITLVACSDDTSDTPPTTFTVTIENVFSPKTYYESGNLGFLEPGQSESFSFNAGKGHYLSFATMFVQSNDLFYAPAQNGVALYDANGSAQTGDITSLVQLWDAGTEVNEMPGGGANQAPRQTAPNTGVTENSTVRLIGDVADAFNYPDTKDVISVVISHDGGTLFTVTIENISNGAALATPFAPGIWVIGEGNQSPLFTEGATASVGLERIAEDGDNTMLDTELSADSGLVSPFAPGAFAINNPLFSEGQTASSGLEALAEDGNPEAFANVFNTPLEANGPAPIFPGQHYAFTFTASEGDLLSVATMLVQSNDWFIGASDIPVFDNGVTRTGDITNLLKLYDAGTETDEYPGAGNNQAPRQSGPNTGSAENGIVVVESIAGNLPAISDMIRINLQSM